MAVLHWVALLIACSSHDAPSPRRPLIRSSSDEMLLSSCDTRKVRPTSSTTSRRRRMELQRHGGVAVCVGGDAPAGIPKNVRDPTWACGLARGHAQPSGERVCVDYHPEFPDGEGSGMELSLRERPRSLARVPPRCERHQIEDRCDAEHPCLDGLDCSAAHCRP